MTRVRRLVFVGLIAIFALVVAAPAFAGGGDHSSQGTVAEAFTIAAPDEPAIIVPIPEPEVVEQPWTTKYLVPFFVVSAIAVLIGLAVAYNRSIRGRYKIVA